MAFVLTCGNIGYNSVPAFLGAAGGEDWLATQPGTGNEEMEDIYYEVSEFAEKFNGHYDGWERPADFEDECLN